jgi:hypothetical protein
MGNFIDHIQIIKQVEQFYMSNYNLGVLHVKIKPPIDDTFPVTLKRQSTFNETYQNALKIIHSYMAKHQKITHKGKSYYANSIEHRKSIINSLTNQDYSKYLTNNEYYGKIKLFQ